MPTRFPDYYKLLSISPTATQDDIRKAYKRESLRTHPDRVPNATQEEKLRATEKFQAVADAYYVLSDVNLRGEYDSLYTRLSASERSAEQEDSSNFFASLANIFTGATGTAPRSDGLAASQRPDAQHVFGDVFEELLRPEIDRHFPWWTYLGAASGGVLGFIIGNLPGMVVGGYAGNKLGAIRDAKGKSVAVVFAQLGGSQKAEILRVLTIKVLGSAL